MTEEIIEPIRGAGGGGNKPKPPKIAKDNLNSKEFATILDLLSEGEIEGFATASKEGITNKSSQRYLNASQKDIFVDKTPLLAANANSNNPKAKDFSYQGVEFDARFGTGNQNRMDGVKGTENTIQVNIETQRNVLHPAPPITDSEVDRVRVIIMTPRLQSQTKKGDIKGATITYKIFIQYSGGSYTEVVDSKISGRTGDSFQKDHSIKLDGAFPINVAVKRTSANSTDRIQRDLFFQNIVELKNSRKKYLNSAYTKLRVDSEYFTRVPSRLFRIRGIKVRIPASNSTGTPTVNLQTGRIIYPDGYIFNGVMGAATWCSCPAMCLLDLLTNHRGNDFPSYGLGPHISPDQTNDSTKFQNIDLFSFFTASKFSNELVDDGFGGQEARFSCNVNISGSGEAYNAINLMASCMRCIPVWSNGTISLVQDRPKDSAFLFNLSNISSQGFSYSGSSLKTRSTVINVAYFNMETREIDYETVEATEELKNKLGIVTKTVTAFACTSKGQARRVGKFILFSEALETEICTFTTSIESGVVVRPGTVVSIADPVRASVRRGGRISSATLSQIVVDNDTETDLTDADGATISVILPNGIVETKNVLGVSGKNITLTTPLTQIPNVNAPWLLETTGLKAQKFRIVSVEEQDAINYSITALSYVADKYDFIEDGETIEPQSITTFNQLKEAPSNVSAEELIVLINNQPVTKLLVRWQPVTGAINYIVSYRFEEGNVNSVTVSTTDYEILNSDVGTYEIQVYTLNAALQPSTIPAELTFEAIGKTATPSNVTGLTAEPINEKLVRLRWNLSEDLDVTHGGLVYVRHSTKTDGTGTFTNAVDLIEALPGNSTSADVPYLEGEYILKFQDDGGRFSDGEASVVLDLPDNVDAKLIQTRREDLDSPPFQNADDPIKSPNIFFDDLVTTINLGGTGTFDDIQSLDDVIEVPNLDNFGGISPSGTYFFGGSAGGTVLDLGAIFSVDFKRHFLTEGFYPGDTFDQRTALLDEWTDFEGVTATEVNAEMLCRTTLLDPNTSVTGAYSQTDDLITITKSNHGYKAKSIVKVDFTSGNSDDGEYLITSVVDANSFTLVPPTTSALYTQAIIQVSSTDTNRITITSSAHGLSIGTQIQFTSVTGDGANGKYNIISNNFALNSFEIEPLVADTNIRTIPTSSCTYQVIKTTSGNCTYGPEFTPFQTFANGTYKGRAFEFKAVLTSKDPAQDINIRELGYTASMQRRIEQSPSVIASGAGAKNVTFQHPFFVGTANTEGGANSSLPSIGIMAQNLASGDFFEVTNVSSTGFTVHFKDSSNASINRNFTYQAVGFGKGQ